jgi:hypothetical protein
MDTQGMSPDLTPEERAEWERSGKYKQVFKPATVRPRRMFTPQHAKEMKILINEVLDEREGKSGISYFDTEHFKYYVGEEEPEYKEWN